MFYTIFCLTEHWLQSYEAISYVENYVVVSSLRNNLSSSGSRVIIKRKLEFKQCKNIIDLSIKRTIENSYMELDQFVILYYTASANFNDFELAMKDSLLRFFQPKKYRTNVDISIQTCF